MDGVDGMAFICDRLWIVLGNVQASKPQLYFSGGRLSTTLKIRHSQSIRIGPPEHLNDHLSPTAMLHKCNNREHRTTSALCKLSLSVICHSDSPAQHCYPSPEEKARMSSMHSYSRVRPIRYQHCFTSTIGRLRHDYGHTSSKHVY